MGSADKAFPGTEDHRTVEDVDRHIKVANAELPPLPRPHSVERIHIKHDGYRLDARFTVDQMQSYARLAVSAALASADGGQGVQVPQGWSIRKGDDGERVIVTKAGLGGYAASISDAHIASTILAHLALDLLAASPQQPEPAQNLTAQLQQRCSDWGVYWRAPDAHGVVLTVDQATELLRDALGVEVEVKTPAEPARAEVSDARIDEIAAAQDDEGWFVSRLTALEWRAFARDVIAAISTTPVAQEQRGDAEPVAQPTSEMLATFKEAFEGGSIWTDRVTHGLSEVFRVHKLYLHPSTTPPAQASDAEQEERWCWYHDGDERVPVLDSEEEAHAEAQQWIDDNCEPGEEHEYLVAPMKNGLQMLPSAGHIATSIIEEINNGLSDEMGAEEWPIEFSKEDITELGEVVRLFIQSRGTVQWWTVDHKREVKHTAIAARKGEQP